MAKATAKGRSGDGVIRGGDPLGYLGHFRSPKVLAAGHNQGAPPAAGVVNPNPISDPAMTGRAGGSTPPRSTVMPPAAQRSAVMPEPSAPQAPVGRRTATAPRTAQGAGVPRSTRTTGASGRAMPTAGPATVTPAQQVLNQLRTSVGTVRQARQSARSILGRNGVQRGRGARTY